MSVVELTWPEVFTAAVIGVMRQMDNLRKGRPDAHGFSGDGWGTHIDGAIAEMALAKVVDRYWMPVTSGALSALEGDVGKLQARSTVRASGSLLLHESDPDDATFVLLIGPKKTAQRISFRIAGTIVGREGKQAKWWRTDTGRPAFFVPQSALAPLG